MMGFLSQGVWIPIYSDKSAGCITIIDCIVIHPACYLVNWQALFKRSAVK